MTQSRLSAEARAFAAIARAIEDYMLARHIECAHIDSSLDLCAVEQLNKKVARGEFPYLVQNGSFEWKPSATETMTYRQLAAQVILD